MAHTLLPVLAVVFVVAIASSAFLALQPWWEYPDTEAEQ